MKDSQGDRSAFLGALRDRLVDGIPPNLLRPVIPAADPAPIAYTHQPGSLIEQFTRALEAVSGQVLDATGGAAALVRAVVEERGVRSAVVGRDPECTGLTELLTDLGVQVAALGDVAAAANADIGITGSPYGIALTGSIVVDSSRAGARSASLLPPVHLALLDRTRILATTGDLLRQLPALLNGPLPSNLVLVTGPSKSADIELILTVGVHGPRELLVGLL